MALYGIKNYGSNQPSGEPPITPMTQAQINSGLTCDEFDIGKINWLYQTLLCPVISKTDVTDDCPDCLLGLNSDGQMVSTTMSTAIPPSGLTDPLIITFDSGNGYKLGLKDLLNTVEYEPSNSCPSFLLGLDSNGEVVSTSVISNVPNNVGIDSLALFAFDDDGNAYKLSTSDIVAGKPQEATPAQLQNIKDNAPQYAVTICSIDGSEEPLIIPANCLLNSDPGGTDPIVHDLLEGIQDAPDNILSSIFATPESKTVSIHTNGQCYLIPRCELIADGRVTSADHVAGDGRRGQNQPQIPYFSRSIGGFRYFWIDTGITCGGRTGGGRIGRPEKFHPVILDSGGLNSASNDTDVWWGHEVSTICMTHFFGPQTLYIVVKTHESGTNANSVIPTFDWELYRNF